ncbi:transporter substrate-binding domain-containing protein [Effusibacillus consociatus]|uniref:Transporter substrate-binding domain-containing protein n=1 Tax=Effusibacillus consociatus TaxID=1117041 RepID=A0ABV9PXD4_9BACL
MKSIKSLSALGISGLLAIALVTGCGTGEKANQTAGQASPEKKVIVMGTSADYPPYEFHDQSSGKDEIVGFDVDIAKKIASELGYELKIQDMDFNGLLPALQAGRVGFVMAGMTPTDERRQNVDFSILYYDAKNTIVAKKGSNLTKPEDLKGKKVGVQLGSIQEGDAKELAKEIQGMELKPLNKIPEIIQEIKAGRIDAAIIEDTVAKGYTGANPDLQFHVIPPKGPNGSAVAFPKGSKNAEEFNKVLKKLKDSGEMEQLVKKWFEQK